MKLLHSLAIWQGLAQRLAPLVLVAPITFVTIGCQEHHAEADFAHKGELQRLRNDLDATKLHLTRLEQDVGLNHPSPFSRTVLLSETELLKVEGDMLCTRIRAESEDHDCHFRVHGTATKPLSEFILDFYSDDYRGSLFPVSKLLASAWQYGQRWTWAKRWRIIFAAHRLIHKPKPYVSTKVRAADFTLLDEHLIKKMTPDYLDMMHVMPRWVDFSSIEDAREPNELPAIDLVEEMNALLVKRTR